jgi:YVTN family beta-propeller protein
MIAYSPYGFRIFMFAGACVAFFLMHGLPCAQTVQQTVPPGTIFELLALNGDVETAARPKYRSPTAMVPSPDGKFLFVAEQTAKRVAVIDLTTKSVTREILLPNEPTGLDISADGTKLYVTCSSQRWPSGTLCEISVSAGTVLRRIAVGHSARSPVINPAGTKIYVCNWLESTISEVDISAGREMARIPVVREPYEAVITKDGNYLIVGNSLPDEKATDTTIIAAKITFISTATRLLVKTISLPAGSHSLFGMCLSNDGKYAFATHLIGRTSIPAITLTGGWVHSNNLAIIDIANQKLANDVALDDATQGVANPWGVACAGDDKFVCIAHAGSNQLLIIDQAQLITKANAGTNLSQDFTSLAGIKKTVFVQGRAPRAVSMIGTTVYVAPYFSDAIYRYAVSLSTSLPIDSLALGPAKPFNAEREGEFRFGDASLCFQKWQSCFSCHPFTRPDALNWILSQAVNNAPKNVKSLLYCFQTPPENWLARRATAFISVEYGIRLELQIEPSPDATVPLDTFLMKLQPVPSPFLVKGRLSDAAKRGKQLFYTTSKTDCAWCHKGALFTDLNRYAAGVPDIDEANTIFDTPSLIEAWRTAPYNHLGSMTTLEEIARVPGHSTNVYRLTTQEMSDLMEFIKSL